MSNIINIKSQSDSIKEIAGSLLKAKRAFTSTGLSAKNAHQKYSYAKMQDIYDAVKHALHNNNIIIVHQSYVDVYDKQKGDTIEPAYVEYLITKLIHAPSEEYIADIRILESEKPGNQGKSAANTYMRKVAVLSLCAIATEDDDGEEEQKYIESNKITAEQYNSIKDLIGNDKQLYVNLLKAFNLKTLSDITRNMIPRVVQWLANETNKG